MTDEMWAFRLERPTSLTKFATAMPAAESLGDGQVLVRLLAGGICGSDLPFFKGDRNFAIPMVDESAYSGTPFGASLHEIVGEVVASRDDALHEGDRVVGWATAMDGLAEYVVTEGASLARFDQALPPTIAVMLQPLACVLYAVEQVSAVRDRRVAVLGLGPIGLLFAHVLADAGAATVIGVDKVERAEVADSFQISDPVHSTVGRWVNGLDDERRPDLIVEAIGHQVTTLGQSVDAVAKHGEIYYFGVADDEVYPVPMLQFLRKNLTLRSGTTYDRRRMLLAAGEYVQKYPALLGSYVTNIYPIDDAQKAFESAVVPAAGRLKIVLEV